MGQFFGVQATAGGLRAAQYQNNRPMMLLEEASAPELKALLAQPDGSAGQIILADAAGRTLRQMQELLRSWHSSGLSVPRVLDPHTAIALSYAWENAFQTRALIAVVECDQTAVMISFLEQDQEMLEELSFHRIEGTDASDALQQALAKTGRQLPDLRIVLILDSEEQTGRIRYILSPGSRIVHYTGRTVALGAALYAGILQGTLSGPFILGCTKYALGIKPAGSSCARMLPEFTTYPCIRREEFPTNGKSTLDFSLIEEEKGENTLGTYRVSGIPAETKAVSIELAVGSDGKLTINASPAQDLKKRLALSAVTAAPAQPKQAPSAGEDSALTAVQALLPVYDNLYLAISQPCSDPSYKKGIEQIFKSVTKQLHDLGAEPYGAEGEPFDPNIHNAVIHLPDYNRGEKEISRIFRQGFRMNGSILRFADVQVAN